VRYRYYLIRPERDADRVVAPQDHTEGPLLAAGWWDDGEDVDEKPLASWNVGLHGLELAEVQNLPYRREWEHC